MAKRKEKKVVTEEKYIPVTIVCDECSKEFAVGSGEEYYEVTVHVYRDYENYDVCSVDCLKKHMGSYLQGDNIECYDDYSFSPEKA